MGIFDAELDGILGYSTSEDGKVALSQGSYLSVRTHIEINPFISDLIRMVKSLNGALYPTADISDYITTLETATFGPEIRKAIYSIFKELSRVSGIYIGRELAAIRLAHFGSDMRQPIHDALIKLGIELDLYIQTTGEHYIWYEESNGITLIRYIGPEMPYIILPQSINDIPVKTVSSVAFTNNTNIMGVRIPSGITTI